MADLTLTIHTGNTDYVYDDVSVLASDLAQSLSYTDGQIEGESFELQILTDTARTDLPDGFRGETDPVQLPGGPYAATLVHDGQAGQRTYNGVVRREGISVDRYSQSDTSGVWTVRFETSALERFEEALEDIRLQNIITTSEARLVQTSVRYEDGGVEKTTQVQGHWYDLRLMWNKVVSVATQNTKLDSVTITPGLFPLRVRWVDGNGDVQSFQRPSQTPQYDELHVGLTSQKGYDPTSAENPPTSYDASNGDYFRPPDWSALELWRLLKNLHGWVVRVPYISQSASYEVQADLRTTFDVPNQGVASPLFVDGYDVVHEPPPVPDVGLTYDMPVRGATAYPELAVYAARRRRVDADFKPYNRNVERMRVQLARFRSNTDWSAQVSPGPSGYGETLRALEPLVGTTQSAEDVQLAELYDDSGTWRTLLYHEPDDPAAEQLKRIGPQWMWERYFGHALSTLPRVLVRGTIDALEMQNRTGVSVDTLTIGDPARSVDVDGQPFTVVERNTELDSQRTEIEATSPLPRDPSSLTGGADGPDLKEVQDLEAYKQRTDIYDTGGDYLYSAWTIWIEYTIPSPSPSQLVTEIRKQDGTVLVSDDDVLVRGSNDLYTASNQSNPPASPPSTGPQTYEDAFEVFVASEDDVGNQTNGQVKQIDELSSKNETV